MLTKNPGLPLLLLFHILPGSRPSPAAAEAASLQRASAECVLQRGLEIQTLAALRLLVAPYALLQEGREDSSGLHVDGV